MPDLSLSSSSETTKQFPYLSIKNNSYVKTAMSYKPHSTGF
jgi:hypothetical protein